MLPTGVDIMVVKVVTATQVVVAAYSVVVVNRTALVLGVKIFEHHATQPRAIFQVELGAQHPVFEVVKEETRLLLGVPFVALAITVVVELEHRREILIVLVGIKVPRHPLAIIIETNEPTAQHVAFLVAIHRSLARLVAACRHKGMPKATNALVVFNDAHAATAVGHIGRSAKESGLLQSQLERPGNETVLAAYLQVARLAVVEHMVGIFALPIGERMLPTVVGHHAVSYVAFHLKPTAQGRNGPIARQGQSHLGHRTRVDSQRLRPTAQPIVLQLHGLLLGSDGQCAMKPTALNKRLLHHHVAGVMKRGGHIEAIPHAPTA